MHYETVRQTEDLASNRNLFTCWAQTEDSLVLGTQIVPKSISFHDMPQSISNLGETIEHILKAFRRKLFPFRNLPKMEGRQLECRSTCGA